MIKVGDRVVCVKAHPDPDCPLIVGREYIVYDSKFCCRQVIDIGITDRSGSRCFDCNIVHSKNIWWLDASRFRKVEEKVNYVKLEIEIEEPILN